MKLPRRTTLTFKLTIVLWLVAGIVCLGVTLLSAGLLIANVKKETLTDLRTSTQQLIELGLSELSVEDEHEKLPSILKGVLSITRAYRIIRIFDEWGILMYSNFPHDEVSFLDDNFKAWDPSYRGFKDQAQNYVSYKATYRLISGEKRLIQMSQPLPRMTTVVKDSLLQYSMIFLALMVGMLMISMYIAGRLMSPIRRMGYEIKALKDKDLKSWRALPELKDGDFLDDIVQAVNQLISQVQTSTISNQSLARFMAHEVRTPLTMMLGEIDTSSYSKMSVEDYQKMLSVFAVDIKKIDQIVNTILEMAQRDRRQTSSRPVPTQLGPLLDILQNDFFKVYGVKVHVQMSSSIPEVSIDPDLLLLLLDNLLRNSVKHGGTEAQPEIHVFQKSSQVVVIHVIDRGPGLSDDVIDSFVAEENVNAGVVGIGLTLCREICRLGSYKMSFENLKPGLRVSIDLPISRDQSSQTHS